MVSYDEVLTLGIYYGLVPFFATLALVLFYAFNRHRKRRWVWADIQLRSGPSFRKQYHPQKGMLLTKKYGGYVAAQQGQAGTFKGKPLFRYLEGNPYPILYTVDRIPVEITDKATNVKKTIYQEIVKSETLAPSSYRISAYERDRTHAQVYGGAARLEIMLLLIAVLVIVAIIATVAK